MAVKLGVGLLVLPVLLGLVVPRAAANAPTKYFEIGGELVLKPEFSETITGITWKHKGNIVAEWIKDTVPLEYLGDLKDRTELDETTGILTVRNMMKSDEGEFTVEINNRVLPDSFKAVGVNRLDGFPLEIRVQPLACASKDNCTLVCEGAFQDAGPVQYSWKFGEKGVWKEDDNKININRAETVKIDSFTCKAKNPVSEKVSAPHENPFISEPPGPSPGMAVGLGILGIILAAICVFAILAFKKLLPPMIQDRLPCGSRDAGGPNAGGGSVAQTANGRDPEVAAPPETLPLNPAPESNDKL